MWYFKKGPLFSTFSPDDHSQPSSHSLLSNIYLAYIRCSSKSRNSWNIDLACLCVWFFHNAESISDVVYYQLLWIGEGTAKGIAVCPPLLVTEENFWKLSQTSRNSNRISSENEKRYVGMGSKRWYVMQWVVEQAFKGNGTKFLCVF